MEKPPLIVICGPTASGKSQLALSLAEQFSGYIISADSRQVYRGMDIGTAKPTSEERRRVPHFMIDVTNPNEPFTVSDYQRAVMEILSQESGLPFLVGGTGLYIDAVTHNWDIPKSGTTDVRSELETESLEVLVERLHKVDPESTRIIDLKNKRRVIRALEVAEQTGESILSKKAKRSFPYRVLKLGIEMPREELIKKINGRVDEMMSSGLLDEARELGKRYSWDQPALSGLGYRQLGAHLRGERSLDEAVGRMKIETRQYAKRQMTWFRHDPEIQWIETEKQAQESIQVFLRAKG